MPSVLITGANRGLGWGLLNLYAKDGWRVFAGTREPAKAKELNDLAAKSGGKVTVHKLDVEDHASIDALAKELKGQPIDVLLNVAGYYGPKIVSEPGGLQDFGQSDYADWDKIYRINVMGPMKVAEALIENVAASTQKKIVTLSSILGSVGGNDMGKMYPYRASKAAINMVMKCMAIDLAPKGIIAIPIHPGWVRTDMGGPTADIDVDTSVTGMKKVIAGLKPSDAGKFMVYDGSTLPW
ncbi:MAG: SDR family oxidoreductase [Rhodospirillaceae bacterium]|nr:SDR family oxidoreductase [Rhodospirillaceae bacterium]